jgi:hypothetical protein
MLHVLLTVADLAGLWNCSRDYVCRRLNPSHPQFIPNKRLPSRDVRFEEHELVEYLKSPRKQIRVFMSGSSVRGGIEMTRNRDRKGSLLVRGRKRRSWLVQWPKGDKRLSHKLGWRDEMTVSQAQRARHQWMEKINGQRDIAGDSVILEGFFREHYWHEEAGQYRDELSTKKPSTRRDRISLGESHRSTEDQEGLQENYSDTAPNRRATRVQRAGLPQRRRQRLGVTGHERETARYESGHDPSCKADR